MKFTTSLISAIALHAAAAVANTCNVEGKIFTITVNKQRGNTLMENEVALTLFDKGIGARLILWSDDYNDPTQKRTSFYINKSNNRLIAANPWEPQLFATAYTEKAEGGEIKFTYEKDSSKDYHWPTFGEGELGELTVDGNDFYLCGSTNGSIPLDGSLAIGDVAGKNCQILDDTFMFPLDSHLM